MAALCKFQMYNAGRRFAEVWEVRAQRLERALRLVLASDLASEEQRADIVAVVCGRKYTGRDRKTLSTTEADLIRYYRAADADGKHMLRTMAQLAGGAR
jgi:hypothetical protein